MKSTSRLSRAQREKNQSIKHFQLIRSVLIQHLQASKLTEVDLDSYVTLAYEFFVLTETKVGNFHDLPTSLVDVAESRKYGLPHEAVQSIQIASMMLNIRDGLNSEASEALPVQCPSCGKFCLLTASHHAGRKPKHVYYCNDCDYSVRAFSGDKWPAGIPASREIRFERGQLKLAIDKVAIECGQSPRSIRLKMAIAMGFPVGTVASEGNILNYQYLDCYKEALYKVKANCNKQAA
ncbi:hypothetical protein AB6E94_19565 [Vibrio lentus]|uniref:hypothetical protein n=1 Tax=Vibrio splendidus TaxID=29497 RepID=UPI000C85FC11|nr:hypothetical protein [Vibrio splendidus]PMG17901.1 hypothetical protein BCU98_00785 [Vibrio splendidus]